ncbi:MAG: hypothetical protein H8M99_15695 [Gloeobacteraceae cyanobacterium ES-bin-144]|nr:hypothetical protein [Verrucomicrobiales bacterium]
MFLFILGYGEILRLNKPWDSPVMFWVANIIFYGVFASLAIRVNHEGLFSTLSSKISNFHNAFIPEYEAHQVLDALGGLSFVTLTVWMPIAALLSTIALIITVRQNRHRGLNGTEAIKFSKEQ